MKNTSSATFINILRRRKQVLNISFVKNTANCITINF